MISNLRGVYISILRVKCFQHFKGCVVVLIYTPYFMLLVITLLSLLFIYLYVILVD